MNRMTNRAVFPDVLRHRKDGAALSLLTVARVNDLSDSVTTRISKITHQDPPIPLRKGLC
jgi:hypothetical protein